MKIVVIGLGYVGSAMKVTLSSVHEVKGYDIDPSKNGELSSLEEAVAFSDAFLLCLPTDYSEETNQFNTTALDKTIEDVYALKPHSTFVVKSTVPMGYCDKVAEDHPLATVLFCPEFLREASAVTDAQNPSRIVVGYRKGDEETANEVAQALLEAVPVSTPVCKMSLKEAEAVKLFSNAYLALRISFFNELDSYALSKGLSASSIIEGVGLDPRIGSHYCNPSFGYGGYCLPKDTRQLEANFKGIPQNLISAVISSNATRKALLAKEAYERVKDIPNPVIGIYRLRMEKNSSSTRYTSMEGVIQELLHYPVQVQIYEPLLEGESVFGCPLVSSFEEFASTSSLILSNRMEEALLPFLNKVFTRDRGEK